MGRRLLPLSLSPTCLREGDMASDGAIGQDGHVSWGVAAGELGGRGPQAASMARGRKARADESIIASAMELAPLARRLATDAIKVMDRDSKFSDQDGIVPRILSLAASIEGMAGGPLDSPGDDGKRAFLRELVVGEVYVTCFPHRSGGGESVEWSLVSADLAGGTIVADRGGKVESVEAADWGLCAYGLGSGAWHPYAWTRKTSLRELKEDVSRVIGDHLDALNAEPDWGFAEDD